MFNNKFTKKDPVVDVISNIIKEEPQQVDELSVPTMGSYFQKSLHQTMSGKKDRTAGMQKAYKKMTTKKTVKSEDTNLDFKDYLIDSYKNSLHDIEQIDEKEMSPAQQKKKEEIVLSMKDKQKEFKAKYGKRWKEVMYATATKMAMKEETLDEKWDDEDDDVARADRELARMKAKPIPAAKIDTDKDKIKKTAKDKEEEMDESVDFDEIYESYECFEEVEQIDEISRDLAKRYISKTKPEYSTPKEIAKRSAGRGLALKKVWGDKKYGLDEPKVKATEEFEQIDELSKGTLKSYINKSSKSSWDLTAKQIAHRNNPDNWTNDPKIAKKQMNRSIGIQSAEKRVSEQTDLQENYGDMSHAAKELVLHADNDHHLYHSSHQPIVKNLSKKMKKGVYHPEKAKKLWAYHADRAAQSYAKHHGDGTPWHKMFSTSDRKSAASHWEDMHRHELHEGKDPSMDAGCGSEQPFVTGANTSSSPMMKKIKEIACSSRNRIKSEMLGKAGATSEEVDPSVKSTDMLKGRVKGGKSDDVGPGADGKSTKIKFIPGPK